VKPEDDDLESSPAATLVSVSVGHHQTTPEDFQHMSSNTIAAPNQEKKHIVHTICWNISELPTSPHQLKLLG